jgi:Kef-type K+ transport system membrane component KefB
MPLLHVNPLTVLLWQIAAIMLVSMVLARLLRALGQPVVVAQMLAGVSLGPSLFGWVAPGAMTALFPPSSMGALTVLSQIGLVLFMFLVGVRLNGELLARRSHAVLFISHASIALPLALGATAACWLLPDYSTPQGSPLASALFLGIAMSVTAFPVLARILQEQNLCDSRVGAVALACAAVDDVTGWCLLAFVVALTRAGEVMQGLWTTALTISFILVMWYGVRPQLARCRAWLTGHAAPTVQQLGLIFLLLAASSSITELIGIHALFGAFLFGLILPRRGNWRTLLVRQLEAPIVAFFLPIFFACSGLRTQINSLDQPREWLVAAVLTLVATVGKFGGSAVAARISGLAWRDANVIGVLMNTRGLMELVVLNIGLDLGVISSTVFTMMVLMALVTTFATTPVLGWIYSQDDRREGDRLQATRPQKTADAR